MLERFRIFRKRERLTASHVNRISRSVEQFAHQRGGGYTREIHDPSGFGRPLDAPWQQFIFTITDLQIDTGDSPTSGLYLGRIRWYSLDGDDWNTDTDDRERVLDAREFSFTFVVGDKVVAYWDRQREAFIPIAGGDVVSVPMILVDYNGVAATPLPQESLAGGDISFALEISTSQTGPWYTVNSRICVINGNVMLNEAETAKASGAMHYTFESEGIRWLRVACNTNIQFSLSVISPGVPTTEYIETEVDIDFAAIRLEMKRADSELHSTSPALTPSMTVEGWVEEAAIGNAAPTFLPNPDGTIKVTTPTTARWTVECELAVVFEIHESLSSQSSTSSSSTSSTSSISTSSSSTSSISTSSTSSPSSSTSSISTSSTSSSSSTSTSSTSSSSTSSSSTSSTTSTVS